MTPQQKIVRVKIERFDSGISTTTDDFVALEEPLEIRLSACGGTAPQSLSITMRTPGDDFNLVAGFLFAENIIASKDDIRRMTYCVGTQKSLQEYNVISVDLGEKANVDNAKLLRNTITSASCGVCGKSILEALQVKGLARVDAPLRASAALIQSLIQNMRQAQSVFAKTGGVHAAVLFDRSGSVVASAEDVGRHNAVDKVIGAQVLAAAMPLHERILMVSGRTSFEILQKALAARIPIVAAVGAPSSLAVDLAREFNVTLIGFLQADRFNVYSAPERIVKAR